MEKISKKYQATATVRILDRLNVAVPGAIVTGSWYFKGALVRSGATAATTTAGEAVLLSPQVTGVSGNLFRFVVTGVSKSGYLYDSAANTLSEKTIAIP